jgi:hypothetical protein
MTARGAGEPWAARPAYVWSGSGFGQGPQTDSASAAPSGRSGAGMIRTWWAWARLVGGAVVLTVLVWQLGTAPFPDGLRTTSGWSLAGAAAVVTTVYCAWRWSSGLSQPPPMRRAGHCEPSGRTTHSDPPMRPAWMEPARWLTPAAAEPKGATRG